MSNTLNVMKATIAQQITQDCGYIKLHDVIAGVLKDKFQGKKLNKRLETYVQAKLGDQYTVSYRADAIFNRAELVIAPLRDWNNRMTFIIGKLVDSYDVASFEQHDACHGSAARERVAKRSALLDNDTALAEACDAVDAAAAAWKHMQALIAAPELQCVQFELQRLTGLEAKRN